ncbi:MAG: hypothetical protein COA96_08110 [SAR86 cluster bacterium]|uniref:Uncharacterized protein n=1 Tax=SAR86 cluster bacterium TaxID=2030880 RepID=A0A2A5B0L5_9GAMM|nr:MAG: hypothetical protein COA96_08110 [SAR86 cluster bacterium]
MKFELIKKMTVIASIGLFSQFALADAASAQKTIAGIVAGMNHFPSDAEKAQLVEIAGDENSGRGMQMIANAVINIQHAANAEGKTAMQQIIDYPQASASAISLAQVVLGFNHMASAEAKETLAGL